ncbi:hypothetical protein HD596_008989 [Nonomuraea jabiensis]|uniref:Uncharacterized protein n=1 Tax=Nonomuraea jabiensis TaxID=882448 RepID=A0A7W9LFX7_9ACTN|nr:hypothetical protein [Nonomuraea jabiensis]MBB5782233.1 hypothetical protein [Nonomuraea jabiensis]
MNALVERLVNEPLSKREVVERYADVLLAIPRSEVVAQFEAYLDASRRSELEQVVHGVLARSRRSPAVLSRPRESSGRRRRHEPSSLWPTVSPWPGWRGRSRRRIGGRWSRA